MPNFVQRTLDDVCAASASTILKVERSSMVAVLGTAQGIAEAAREAWQHRETTMLELAASYAAGTGLASAQSKASLLPVALELGALSATLQANRWKQHRGATADDALRDAWNSPLHLTKDRKQIAQSFGAPIFHALLDETAACAGAIIRRTVPVYWKENSILSAMKRYHLETWAHSVRVGKYSEYISRELGLSRTEQSLASHAGAMHDAGKLDVQLSILDHQGAMGKEQWHQIHQHPIWSQQRLEGWWYSAHLKKVPRVARVHHEKLDGTGYPDQLKDVDMTIVEKLVPVADIFDALTGGRKYQNGRMALAKVKQIIDSEARHRLEPDAVAALWRLPASKMLLVLQRGRKQPPRQLIKELKSSGIEIGPLIDVAAGQSKEPTAEESHLAKAFEDIYNHFL